METKKIILMVFVGLLFTGADSGAYPLLWEAARPDSAPWSAHALSVIEEEGNTFLGGTDDIRNFCPRYDSLNNSERMNFWGLLISAVAKFESNFSPVSRMLEGTLGKDSVTGLRVYSEGLLQLSYQDTTWASYCEFDWNADKKLNPKDPQKTILDPYKNLTCGIKIMARQIAKRGVIAARRGQNYWSTLIPGGRYSKLTEIQKLTKKMPGCE